MYSVKDVVSHPGYDVYVVNTSENEIERMRRILTVHEYWQRVTNRVTRFRLSEIVPSGTGFDHYKECVWSDPNCETGPDTCVCSYISVDCTNIVRLLNRLWTEQNENIATSAQTKSKGRGLFEIVWRWWWRWLWQKKT